ncbi:MAG: alpha/beta fold hydrolase [Peptococcaceae bacterium]|nr:alpha/beta fold hydrolase [Candidatus Syntrophopropionicum ammoniitolerans]
MGTKQFHFPGSSVGCLLIHGFCGTPGEMIPLGRYLHDQGPTVKGILLNGHGTKPLDLRGRSHKDWIDAAAAGLTELKKTCSHVFLIGFSMGGTIALHLAANYQVDGVITICAPVYLEPKMYLMRPLKRLLQHKKMLENHIKDPGARKTHFSYKIAPPGAIIQLFNLLRLVRPQLKHITVPALVFQTHDDGIIPSSNGPFIYNGLVNTAAKKFTWLKKSGHMAVVDYDKELIMWEINDFIEDCLLSH